MFVAVGLGFDRAVAVMFVPAALGAFCAISAARTLNGNRRGSLVIGLMLVAVVATLAETAVAIYVFTVVPYLIGFVG
jgi:hypothetical protein